MFCSYGGEALDKKTPLLRSMAEVSRQAVRVLHLFGDTDVQQGHRSGRPRAGVFPHRPASCISSGRTCACAAGPCSAASPPRAQELDDHYFGAIRPRVAAYMKDLDEELWKLGVLSKTKHNEVAPAQHEMAPIYADANTANDQNQLVMETMKKVAERHGLVCLLHEKPFAGVQRLRQAQSTGPCPPTPARTCSPPARPPARTPSSCCSWPPSSRAWTSIRSCCAALWPLRATTTAWAPRRRLPPSSPFSWASELEGIVDAIVGGSGYSEVEHKSLRIGVDVLPAIPKDTTDRNRTSPVAFTGNKFEFRMPGSSQSIAGPDHHPEHHHGRGAGAVLQTS